MPPPPLYAATIERRLKCEGKNPGQAGLRGVDRACRDGTVETAALDPCRDGPARLGEQQGGERLLAAAIREGGQGFGTSPDGGGSGALVGNLSEQRLMR